MSHLKELHSDEKMEFADEKVEVGNQHSGVALTEHERAALTRRVLFKLDTRILPVLTLLFLCSFLDRTNAGNAKTYHLVADLKMTDHEFDIGLTVFYATYIASEIPSNLVLKKISPKIWLPTLTMAWGLVTMCLGFVKSYSGFMGVRAVLGITEGGLLPGIVLYLSGMYTRPEMALRIGLFYTAASASGAFGGLLARGLTTIELSGGLFKWSWIFIIEGLITIVVGVIAFLLLPNSIATASFLKEDEKAFAVSRLRQDVPTRLTENGTTTDHETFQWSEVRRGIFNISTWLSASAYFGILAGLYSFGLFLPTIIVELGYTNNEAQLWSVIPYAVASVITVFIAILSDRLKLRGVIMLFTLIPAIIGYAVISTISVEHPKVKYGMTFLMATGLYSSVPPVLVWNSNNSAGHYKRATTTALQLMIANSGGFVATFIYPAKDKPQFRRGHRVVLGLLVAAWFLVLANVMYCRKVNKDKANGKYDKYIGYADDRDPDFKLVL